MSTPTFSVVIATYERGPAIGATLTSVANQSEANFEVLVVSDGPPAPGLAATIAEFDARFTLLELPERTRSQSGPNNAGWSAARGQYIAYLGHDDLWTPNHLALLAAQFEQAPGADFAVSGCIYLGVRGAEVETTWVTGIFDSSDPAAAQRYFFPPSSVAHRRNLPGSVGQWPEPMSSKLPVDDAFQRSAVRAGCRYISTGQPTVLKFASAMRYLSYLCPQDEEQRELQDVLTDAGKLEAFLADQVRIAKDGGLHMPERPTADDSFLIPGDVVRRNEITRGIDQVRVTEIVDSVWLPVSDETRGFDWYPVETDGPQEWRWSGPSDRPRLALPWHHPQPVLLRLHLAALIDLSGISVQAKVDGVAVPAQCHDLTGDSRRYPQGGYVVEIKAQLRKEKPSVLELLVVPQQLSSHLDQRKIGIPLRGIEVETMAAAAEHPEDPLASRVALILRTHAHLALLDHVIDQRNQAAGEHHRALAGLDRSEEVLAQAQDQLKAERELVDGMRTEVNHLRQMTVAQRELVALITKERNAARAQAAEERTQRELVEDVLANVDGELAVVKEDLTSRQRRRRWRISRS